MADKTKIKPKKPIEPKEGYNGDLEDLDDLYGEVDDRWAAAVRKMAGLPEYDPDGSGRRIDINAPEEDKQYYAARKAKEAKDAGGNA